MKKLQNCFTTPEQSKRLLEIGVPADSADCYLYNVREYGWRSFIRQPYYNENVLCGGSIPCWSVGRLIEIITICCNHYSGNNDIIFNQAAVNHGTIECLIAYLAIEKKDVSVDFSKLS